MTEALDRQQEPGWLLPYLVALDTANVSLGDLSKKELKDFPPHCPTHFTGHRRWEYWLNTIEAGKLLDTPIPQLDFDGRPRPQDEKAIQDLLQVAVRRHYSWYPEAWINFVRWILFGFGKAALKDEIARIPEDLRESWYHGFNLANLLNSPCDWSAFVLQGGLRDDKSTLSPWAKSTGFYSTPMPICKMMSMMVMGDGVDHRRESVADPCCGTGSMLLAASNYSLRLYGQDIVFDLCLCAELNGWLWMPWLVFMPPETEAWLEGENRIVSDGRVFCGDTLAGEGIGGQMASQRRQSAEDFQAAVKTGKLSQGYLWGEE